MVNQISDWQEAISTLPDNKFFDIMRLYLGEIQTPYNKHNLISRLASFIRNETNSKNLVALIDGFDAKVITAISFIPNATENKLADFFCSEYTMAEIFSEISNLKERLIVYSDKNRLCLNPLLEDELKPFIKIRNILQNEAIEAYSMEDTFSISPEFLAAFISFINIRGCSCKNDGTIKKNDLNRLNEAFSGRMKTLQLLLTAFSNLRLIKEGGKSYETDMERFRIFAELPELQQYALLCAASCSHLSRDGLKKEAQLLLDVISSIPETGYSRATVIKLAFLVGTKTEDGTALAGKSKFSRLIEAARQEANTFEDDHAASIIDRMIESAIEFGILQCAGRNAAGTEIYIKGMAFNGGQQFIPEGSQAKVLNIDSTFTVTLMPGLHLKQLLSFTNFMVIKNFAVAAEFELTRQSVSASFDKGFTPDKIFSLLEDYTYYQLPQNLKISITDWFNSYSSARLYVGYVLKVTDSNIAFAENNPNINRYIKEKLAEGIYLLNIPVDADISEFIESSGLEFMGKVKNPEVEAEKISFPLLRSGRPLSIDEEEETKINFSTAGELIKSLRAQVDEMKVEENQKESLLHRIQNRLILTTEQLETTFIRTEILEANGMDFAGKLHLLEAAAKEHDMVEITIPQFNRDDQYFTILGYVSSIARQPGDAIVIMEVYPQHETQHFVVSRITHIRRLRF
ncbi:MAG: helicase-associated domain-containing protein [Treponema sp.]|nr:helicase-associated domain-containing protein [Treponema sp.]